MKGVPVRYEVGPRDVANGQVCIVRRDTGEKKLVPDADVLTETTRLMNEIFDRMKSASETLFKSQITECNTMEELVAAMKEGESASSSSRGFARVPFCSMTGPEGRKGDQIIHERTCGGEVRGYLTDEAPPPPGTKCIATGAPATVYAYVAKGFY